MKDATLISLHLERLACRDFDRMPVGFCLSGAPQRHCRAQARRHSHWAAALFFIHSLLPDLNRRQSRDCLNDLFYQAFFIILVSFDGHCRNGLIIANQPAR